MSSPEFEKLFKTSLTLFKEKMPTGIPEVGIPPLDPLKIDPYDIPSVDEKLIQLNGSFRDVEVHALKTVEVERVETNIINGCLTLSCTLEARKLKATGKYDLKGVALGFIPLDMAGNATIEANKVSAAVTVDWSSSSAMAVQVNIGTIHVEHINANFEKLGKQGLEEILAEIINQLGTQIFKALGPLISVPLSDALQKVINKELADQKPQMSAVLSQIISSFSRKKEKPQPEAPNLMRTEDVTKAVGILKSVSSKWDEIGMKLQIEDNTRGPLKTDNNRPQPWQKLEAVLVKWVESHNTGATWEELKTVLEEMGLNESARMVGEHMQKK